MQDVFKRLMKNLKSGRKIGHHCFRSDGVGGGGGVGMSLCHQKKTKKTNQWTSRPSDRPTYFRGLVLLKSGTAGINWENLFLSDD